MALCRRAPFSRKFYKRARITQNVVTGAVIVSCLLYDWDSYLGTKDHAFSGIRPAVRRALDWAWGVSGASSDNTAAPSAAPAPPPRS